MYFRSVVVVLATTLHAISIVAMPGLRGVERGVERRQTHKKCGNEVVPAELMRPHNQNSARDVAERAATAVSVDTYMHVVVTPSAKSKYPASQLQNQFAVLNNAYNPYGISFTLRGLDYTINSSWATGGNEQAMKTKLRRGGYAALNLYFLEALSGDEPLLGICTFPTSDAATDPNTVTLDGCMMVADTLPGGSYAPYNLGITAVHEVGHWFGLFHPFQGGDCTGPGDYVADTPAQSTPSFGCATGKDSCPAQPGLDSIHDYMDYSDDSCLTMFTTNQIARADDMYATLRAGR